MSEDIIEKIDAALLAEHNAKRFDPFGGEAWDEDRVERWGDGMRIRPAGMEPDEPPARSGPPVATGDSSPAARSQFVASVAAFQRGLHLGTHTPMRLNGDWPLHDNHPAEGDWPGGPRYGFSRDRLFRERRWTPEEHERAAELGIALPEMDWQTVDLWWDMPRMETAAVERIGPAEPLVFSPDALIEPTGEMTFRRTVRTAKRYAVTCWDTDPFASAPAPSESSTPPTANRTDPVADAFRDEVLRQGLTECEIDGMREIYEDDRWRLAELRRIVPVAPGHILTSMDEPWWRRMWRRG